MKEVYGDMWHMRQFSAICVTVNWETNNQGYAIMGAGCAKEARIYYPDAPEHLGTIIKSSPVPRVVDLPHRSPAPWEHLIAFPTKYSWRNAADIDLIKQSCRELQHLVTAMPHDFTVLLPRPGTGKGGLDWFGIVKPAISDLLGKQISIVSFAAHAF